jgi:hypothetical protein
LLADCSGALFEWLQLLFAASQRSVTSCCLLACWALADENICFLAAVCDCLLLSAVAGALLTCQQCFGERQEHVLGFLCFGVN